MRGGLKNSLKTLMSRMLKSSAGFSVVELTIATVMGTVVLSGTWWAYRNFAIQMRVVNADRQMDTYARSAMSELTNMLSWAWGAEAMQGGQYSRWKVVLKDIVEERGSWATWEQDNYTTDQSDFLQIYVQPNRGLMVNNNPANFYNPDGRTQYVFLGQRRQTGLSSYDRRDRMTVEGFTLEYHPILHIGNSNELIEKERGAVVVNLTMQYRYRPQTPNLFGTSLYGDGYVRERTYTTTVFMRNWDVTSNSYREALIQLAGSNNSQG